MHGCTVKTAADGFEALKLLRETLPDIIISDLRMPNMSGFELLAIVRRRFPHLPVIGISGEYVAEGLPGGLLVDVFHQKGGYTQEALLADIRRLVAESPIRPHLVKCELAPLWIPRRDADYIVVTCTECLRSFAVSDDTTGTHVHEEECPACGTKVKYIVDSAVLRVLDEKRKRLPAR